MFCGSMEDKGFALCVLFVLVVAVVERERERERERCGEVLR